MLLWISTVTSSRGAVTVICHAGSKHGHKANTIFPGESLNQFLSNLIFHTAQVVAQAVGEVPTFGLEGFCKLLERNKRTAPWALGISNQSETVNFCNPVLLKLAQPRARACHPSRSPGPCKILKIYLVQEVHRMTSGGAKCAPLWLDHLRYE